MTASDPEPHPPQIPVVIGGDAAKPYVAVACCYSLMRHTPPPRVRQVNILDTELLRMAGVYTRQSDLRGRQHYDRIDGKPFSTAFSYSRFLVPSLADPQEGWLLWCDDDFLWLESADGLIPLLDNKYAVMVVKHDFQPPTGIKMDGQIQQSYRRKNWSSLIAWNVGHPSNRTLTSEVVNTAPGSFLHGFDWLKDDEIGSLPEKWNWLEGHSLPEIEPAAVHYTRGGPWLGAYRKAAYADEWLDAHFNSLNLMVHMANTFWRVQKENPA